MEDCAGERRPGCSGKKLLAACQEAAGDRKRQILAVGQFNSVPHREIDPRITLARDIAVAVVDEGDGRGRVVWTVRTILEPEQRARDDVTKERGAWVQRHEAGVERVVEHTEERGDRRGGAGGIKTEARRGGKEGGRTCQS